MGTKILQALAGFKERQTARVEKRVRVRKYKRKILKARLKRT